MLDATAPAHTLVNGRPGCCVPANDRGLQYGDGLFETVLGREGALVLWERHVARLLSGCGRLGIPAPAPALLATEAETLLAAHGDGILKIIVTRGTGARGYKPPQPADPTRIVAWHRQPSPTAGPARDGVRVRMCRTRLGHNPVLAGIKHLNRLEQVLARGEWTDPDISEGLMLDVDGHPIEGTMSNLFLACDRRLNTPELNLCGVAGVVRSWVLERAAALGLSCEVGTLSVEQVLAAPEVFLCNSVIGIWPVREIDGRALAVGPVTRQVQHALERDADTG